MLKDMTRQSRYTLIELAAVLCLLLLFALLAFSMLGSGADLYQQVTEDMDQNYEVRTPLSYLATKVRQNDVVGGVVWKEVEGKDVLLLREFLEDGRIYETYIYVANGSLCELYKEAGDELTLSDGQPIMPLEGIGVEWLAERTFRMTTYGSEGVPSSMVISLRSTGGAIHE